MSSVLDELITRYRTGEITFDEFIETAASMWVPRPPSNGYYDEDDRSAFVYGVSAVTMADCMAKGALSREEAEAIMAAIPATVP